MMYLVFCLTDGTFRDIRNEYDLKEAGQLVGYHETKLFWKEMDKASSGMELAATFKGETRFFDLADIRYFEVHGRIVTIHCGKEDEEFQTYAHLTELEAVLGKIGFLRISRFYIVSIRHITAIQNWEVRLTSGVRIPVGRAYRKTLKIELSRKSFRP